MRALVPALLSLGLLLAAPALAVPVEVGASGQCWDAAGNGGADEARVAVESDDPTGATVVLPSGTGAAAAVVEFLEGVPTMTACPNRATYDYIEADARIGDTAAQVCYGQGVLHTDGSCPQSPSGL